MDKIISFFRSVPRRQVYFIVGISVLLITLVVFVTPILRRQAAVKLGSAAGVSITADKQDSLGVFDDSYFTLKADEDLTAKAIKDNLKLEPEIEIEVAEISPRQYQIIPKEPLKANEIIRIKLSTGEREYSWAFQTKNTFRVVRTLPSDKTTSVPVSSGIEITFSHDSYEDIANNFSITPATEGRFERHGRTMSFVPKKLEAGTLYTVSLKKGLKLNGSSDTLQDTTTFQFETSSPNVNTPNRFNFVRSTYEFSSKETPAIDLYANNIDSLSTINVNVYKYPSINKFTEDFQNKLVIPQWSTYYYNSFSVSTASLTKVIEFSAPIQKINYSGYFLFPQTLPKGYYLVEADNGSQKSQAFVQITDISAYFTVTGNQTLGWVNRVDTSLPAQSAKVSILGQDYLTDKDGVVIFTSPASLVDDSNKLITIKDSQDTLLIPAADRNYYYSYGDYMENRRVSDKYWSYLYLDRPIYQPGDTVHFWGLLRDRDDLNKSQNITLTLTQSGYLDYDYNPVTIFEKDYQTTSLGTFIGDMSLPKLNPGWYTLNVKVGDKNIISSGLSVETYSKPAYQLTMSSAKTAIIAGEDINLSGKAAFFEGTPVSNAKLKIYGETEREVTTDNLGSYNLSLNTTSNPEGQYAEPVYRYFNVSPVQPEEGDINGGTSVAVFNSSIYLQTKSENTNNQAKISIRLNQIDLSKFEPYQYGGDASFIGAPVQNHSIQAEVFETTWQKKEVGTYYDFINKTTSPKYEYIQSRISLSQSTLTTDGSGQATYTFATSSDKFYEVKLKATDGQNRVAKENTYIYGSGTDSFSGNTNLVLEEEKTINPGNYLINEPVSLTPRMGNSPITTGKVLYLFTQRGIKDYQIKDVGKYTFGFKDNYVPNISVQAVRFTGTTFQISESKSLLFDNSSKKISLGLSLDKSSYLPGDKARLTVSAKDQKGNPLASEVNINLVDEAIFEMSPVTVDPLMQIYRSLSSDIVSFYLSHQYPLDASTAEGGGCFLPGTKILMAEGKSKDIEQIKPGDLIKTKTGENDKTLTSAKVLQVLTHEVGQYLLINNHLRVTPEHNLFINGRWMTASEIKIGDSFLDPSNEYHQVQTVKEYTGKFTVYNLSVDKYHTFFADGFYVHNEKGRDLFVDTAYFGSVQTGANGMADLDITLPDNLTSWRITGQSITQDLKVGVNTEKLVVKLPFFVDVLLGQDYILADKPVITLRGFGDQLKSTDLVTYHISIPSLGFEKDLSAKAFESVGTPLETLTLGNHSVVVTASSGSLKDKITRIFKVLPTRLQMTKSDYQILSPDTKIIGGKVGQTELLFSDQSSGRFLSYLNNLAFTSGDRLDQKLSRILSKEFIKKHFDTEATLEKFDLSVYLMDDGGYALLPYGSSDVGLSAEVACLAGDKIDKAGLVNYFYNNLTQAEDTVIASQSLAGLACLQEPVLLLVDKFNGLSDLDPQAKIYLSLAQAKLGDTEKSISTVNYLLQKYGQNQDNIAYVKIGKNKDDYLVNTSLLAAVAAIDNISQADQLFNYVLSNSAKDLLLNDNILLFIAEKLSKNTPSPVSFSYTLNGKKISKDLKAGQSYKLSLSSEQLAGISFQDIKGSVGVTSTYQVADTSANSSKDLTLNRSFATSGKTTTEFVSTDLVKITLNFSLKSDIQDGCYQINDYLPSGLRVVTRLSGRDISYEDISYPYSINGQEVSFCAYKDSQKPISYYARIISPGSFQAESALMQSIISPSIFTLSNQSSVTIK